MQIQVFKRWAKENGRAIQTRKQYESRKVIRWGAPMSGCYESSWVSIVSGVDFPTNGGSAERQHDSMMAVEGPLLKRTTAYQRLKQGGHVAGEQQQTTE